MASDFEKPDKVHSLFLEDVPTKMWNLPIRALFTCGRSSAEKLNKHYIKTIGDLANSDVARIQKILGVKLGRQLYEFANGIWESKVLAEAEEAKGYSVSTTLPKDVTTFEEAHHILLALTDSVATRLRAEEAKAFCLSVSFKSKDFVTRSHQRKLQTATDVTKEIYEIARQLFNELWDGTTPLRLLGIALTDISREGDYVQGSLFHDEKNEKAYLLDKAVDKIRSKFGINVLKRGSMLDDGLDVGKKYRAKEWRK